MKCLVFVAKTTGFECLKWLLESCKDDDYTFFVCDPNKDEICEYLNQKNIQHHEISDVPNIVLADGAPEYDWLINIWSPFIFHDDILSKVTNSVNLHPSYLPYGRGRDPVVWAIRDGTPAGATLHRISAEIDAGPIWAQTEVSYTFPTKGEDLYNRVEKACIDLFKSEWRKIRDHSISPQPQGRPDLPTRKRKDLFPDSLLNMNDPNVADIISRLIAHDFPTNNYTATLKNGNTEYAVTLQIQPKDKNDAVTTQIR